jgi:hypothetical protein
MSAVVTKRWNSFTVGTEVGVVADGALVARASNILLVGLAGAEMSVAVNAEMHLLIGAEVSNLFEESGETMAWMDLRCAENAGGTVIPVRAA